MVINVSFTKSLQETQVRFDRISIKGWLRDTCEARKIEKNSQIVHGLLGKKVNLFGMKTKMVRKAAKLLRMRTSFCSTWSKVNQFGSVVDPYVFGLSGS